ncbi:hypothetical protein PHLCEN_2v3249 [Hermanssonia centrifuga]|uniref:Uncharacterized protein n=1 Tax=Hermanssonia centrifuga TaxID=98765 RepID=A0A2R6QXI9_9APHY|nr:hypothetical protein PHLCEN_2v3249 [Hermanssonia centrifuga]
MTLIRASGGMWEVTTGSAGEAVLELYSEDKIRGDCKMQLSETPCTFIFKWLYSS